MFQSARFKLTFWYILIIACISVFFSAAFYKTSTKEFDRIKQVAQFRIDHEEDQFLPPEILALRLEQNRNTLSTVAEAERRILLFLVVINLILLLGSAGASYFLAGRTLKPIQEMVNEQNRFISDSSHELRTPLTALRSMIEVNLRAKKLSVKEARELLVSNLEEVVSLQTLAESLLQLTQLGSKNTYQFKKINLRNLGEEAIKKVRPLSKEKDIKIENKLEDLSVEGEYLSLLELFVIFLENAIKYSHPGSDIIVDLAILDHTVKINFKDQGIGIEPSELAHIFDRFYRVDSARSGSKVGGFGLGLSIAKKIAELHQGQIEVESKVGQGSKFSVLLPLK